jgi:predicted phage-related endonuclease
MTASPFHNLSTPALADEFGAMKLQADALNKRLDEMKDELKKRTNGDETVEGAKFTVTVATTTSTRIDTKKLRDVLGDAVREVEATSESIRVTVKPTVIFGQVAA